MKLYIAVAPDKYELPIAVAGSVQELSRMAGASCNTIASSISHSRQNGRKRSRYHRVEVEDDEE